MKKTIIAIAMLLVLAGCASVQQASICTEGYRATLEADKAKLEANAREIDAMRAGKGFMEAGSILPRRDVLAQLTRKHNEAIDDLERRVAAFNAMCTR